MQCTCNHNAKTIEQILTVSFALSFLYFFLGVQELLNNNCYLQLHNIVLKICVKKCKFLSNSEV